MKSDLIMAVNQICTEKDLPREVILKAVEDALVSAYRRNFASNAAVVQVTIDAETGDLQLFCEKQIVEEVLDASVEVGLAEARNMDPNAELGGTVLIERTPADFGRIAAQTAKQVILQRIHEAERDALHDYYKEREGELITGTVQSIDYRSNQVTVSLGKKAEGILAADDQMPNERYRIGQTVRSYLAEVSKGTRGPAIRLSRSHRNMLRRLLEREVPEIYNGIVEIKSIAREPGQRSKVAVAATQPGVDPVGSCVGMRGTRIQNIVDELGGERIDVVEWSSEVRDFITNALSPAKPSDTLLLEEGEARTAVVIVPDRQLSLAIGKEGQNARLAAKLTGWRIDIKSESEANTEGLSEIKRQQMQLLKVRSLESKATASATPPPDDLLSRAEWLLRERDKNAMTLDQVARMLVPSEELQQAEIPAEEAVVAEQATAPEAAEQAPAEAVEQAPAEAASQVPESAAEVPGQPAPEAAPAEVGAQPGEEAMVAPPYENFDVEYVPEAEGEGEGEAGQAAGKRSKSKKTQKKRELVFDEELGQVVAVKKRKGSRGGWGDEY